ncbi:MAG: 50S ribosomal protein L23 [Candidatus Blackburnbacteria bacterium RIFCSPHIGHO2_01_FULL_43_15b]|uniref:Large ribosomal subunit protein uL23 n=1 Tax=Candidatus Blackburnbacteria bacterium RIFCSPHIGHO2_01_FULL_43_15b TaxID=1797513 RepID=A0A1G1UYX8_9BACT|nr:MAG: 50S ribosomal protein L23 [Candidatus Blackburnbacteria bacterium RIFCSPHIGHO2_01_FULL_43_15b]
MFIKPLVTEKTLHVAQTDKQYTFLVEPGLDKYAIKKLVSENFGVHVVDIRTANIAGKQKRFGKKRTAAFKSDLKKAVVTLAEKETISFFEVEKKGKGKKRT